MLSQWHIKLLLVFVSEGLLSDKLTPASARQQQQQQGADINFSGLRNLTYVLRQYLMHELAGWLL